MGDRASEFKLMMDQMLQSTGHATMALEEFVNSGLLQEVNRQFFHPLKLALGVIRDENNVPFLLVVLDLRDREEEVVLKDIDETNRKKMENVVNEQERRAEVRQGKLGYVTQPIRREKPQVTGVSME